MPSRDLDNVRGALTEARPEGCHTAGKRDLPNEDEHMERLGYRNSRFNEAAAEADRKREAAKTPPDLQRANEKATGNGGLLIVPAIPVPRVV